MTIGKKTRHILFGIGNELKGDDGIGNVIAKEFKQLKVKDWLSIPCETVPENFTSIVKKERPKILVIVDAADMEIELGEFRIVPKDKLNSDLLGTHGMALRHIVSYLEKYAGRIIFIGIQPGEIKLDENISPWLKESKKKIMEMLKRKEWGSIKLV
jgi:hydrogenase 3 maturation protease